MMKYHKYKHSDIEWLGEIPSHWRNCRVDWIATIVRGNSGFKKDDLLVNGNYVALQYGKTYKVDEIDNTFNFFVNSEFFKHSQLVRGGDTILVSTSETIEDLGHSCFYNRNELGLLGGEQILLKPNAKIVIEKYLYFFSKFFCSELKRYATGLKVFRFNTDDLKKIFIPIPLLEEQTAIVNYLDKKNQAIDKKITLLSKKTDYYIELRKSLINEVVCKGLGKNVRLQESEFKFSVNSNWKRFRIKDLGVLYSGLSGKAGEDFNQDENLDNKGFIPFTNIANNTYIKSNHLGTVVVYQNEKQNKVQKGDLFFLMSSEGYDDLGKTAVLNEDLKDTYLNSFCKGYRISKRNCDPYFLNYLLLSDNYRKSLMIEGKGFTRINLKMEKVTDFFVYIPETKNEQTAIVNYLDEKTQKIDAIVTNIRTQIDTLRELRKTLINDVVTGKIKVTDN